MHATKAAQLNKRQVSTPLSIGRRLRFSKGGLKGFEQKKAHNGRVQIGQNLVFETERQT